MIDLPSLKSKPSTLDVAIGQLLGLAASANVYVEMIGDRLVVRAMRPEWSAWRPVQHCIDEIGLDAVRDYFRRTTADERQVLASPSA